MLSKEEKIVVSVVWGFSIAMIGLLIIFAMYHNNVSPIGRVIALEDEVEIEYVK
jgi:hypothetical protein